MIRCFRDEDGIPRVDPGDLPRVVATFLEEDVQSSLAYARELLERIEDVASGRLPEWSGTGNAHTITIRPAEVTIENEWTDEPQVAVLSHDALRASLKSWVRCVKGKRRKPPPVSRA
jgi:hypothetical protein